MKAFRVRLFGKYITTIPGFNLTRHEDVPLPESTAEPYHSEEEVQTVKFIPSQDLSDAMMPITDETMQCKLMKQQEKLVRDMEASVSRRDIIITRGDFTNKNPNVVTQGKLQREIGELQKKIKETNNEAGRLEVEIRLLKDKQQQLAKILEDKQKK